MSNSEKPTNNERLSAVETDVRHLDQRLTSLSHELQEGFTSLRRLVEGNRQPFTAFAGWAAVILTIVGAIVYPQMQTDGKLTEQLDKLEAHYVEHIRDGHPKQIQSLVEDNTVEIFENRSNIKDLTKHLREHESLESHPAAMARFESLKERFEISDSRFDLMVSELQREMKQLVEGAEKVLSARLTNLESRTQQEVRDLDELNYWKTRAERFELQLHGEVNSMSLPITPPDTPIEE